jgi:hypothetical protein
VRRRLLVLGLVLVATFAAVRFAQAQPKSIAGPGELYGHLWCMGIRFASGAAHPVHGWPAGFTFETVPMGDDRVVVLKDAEGSIVFREGDRVVVDARLHHVEGGDTTCANLDSLEVLAVEPAAP